MPCGNTLRRTYVSVCGDEERERIRDAFADKHIVIIADETCDIKGRCVFAILFRTSTATSQQQVSLVSVSFLDKANGTTCSQAIIEAIQKYGIQYGNVDGLVSDSARYMGTCFGGLQVLVGEHLVHYQCWAHKINLIGDVFMKELSQLNTLVTKLKMVFLHGRTIKSAYLSFLKENYADLRPLLFPNPVITRWNSWFKSVSYLGNYIDAIILFLHQYENKNGSADIVCGMFEDVNVAFMLKTQCVFIAEICEPIMKLLSTLEGSLYPYAHLIWDQLQSLSANLKRYSEGVFPPKTNEQLTKITSLANRAKVTANLKESCQKGHTKLMLHMRPGTANDIYKEAGQLFNPAIAGQTVRVNETLLKQKMRKLPAFVAVSEQTFIDGYLYFHRQLTSLLAEGDKVDIVQLLSATRETNAEFANAALRTVWSPVNSVAVESFFSRYNLVLNDRRTNLTEENLETCSMLSFN